MRPVAVPCSAWCGQQPRRSWTKCASQSPVHTHVGCLGGPDGRSMANVLGGTPRALPVAYAFPGLLRHRPAAKTGRGAGQRCAVSALAEITVETIEVVKQGCGWRKKAAPAVVDQRGRRRATGPCLTRPDWPVMAAPGRNLPRRQVASGPVFLAVIIAFSGGRYLGRKRQGDSARGCRFDSHPPPYGALRTKYTWIIDLAVCSVPVLAFLGATSATL